MKNIDRGLSILLIFISIPTEKFSKILATRIVVQKRSCKKFLQFIKKQNFKTAPFHQISLLRETFKLKPFIQEVHYNKLNYRQLDSTV